MVLQFYRCFVGQPEGSLFTIAVLMEMDTRALHDAALEAFTCSANMRNDMCEPNHKGFSLSYLG